MIDLKKHLVVASDDRGSSVIGGAPRARNGGHLETAYVPYTGSTLGLPPGSVMSSVQATGMSLPLLDGFLAEHPLMLNRMYREMYYNDPVIGTAIELLSTFPFGDFSLIGLHDERRLSKFADCIDRLRIKQLLPVLSTDYLVMGSFVATLEWDSTVNIFSSIFPQNQDFVTFEGAPFFGAEPVMRLSLPEAILKILNNPSNPNMKRMIEQIPEEMRKAGKDGILLDVEKTMFIPRRSLSSDTAGTSLLRRLIPTWLTEKALIRGTLDQFWKRQRAILHISVGDPDFEPTSDDFQAIAQLFQQADHDPTGAIVATRQGILPSEIRRGDDMLKWSDQAEHFIQMKLRALGVSDAFLGGDTTVSSAEGALNVMLQHLSSYRRMITRELFYDKVFPTIAKANGYTRNQSVVLGSKRSRGEDRDDSGFPGFVRGDMDGSLRAEFAADMPRGVYSAGRQKLSMPKIHWHVNLESEKSTEMIDTLGKLEEKGLPIPLRLWAVAAGHTLESLAEQKESDLRARKYFKPWRDQIIKMIGVDPSGNPVEDESAAETVPAPFMQGGTPRRSILDRTYPELPSYEVRGGKKKALTSTEARSRSHKLHKAMAGKILEKRREQTVADNEERRQAGQHSGSGTKSYHHSK